MPIYQANVLAETGKTVYLRNTPSQKGKVIEAIPIGTVVNVLEETDANWAKISDGGVEGYMMRKFLFQIDNSTKDGDGIVTVSQATIEAIYGHAVSIIELLKEVGLG